MNFEFATATKIVFGSGVFDRIGSYAAQAGKKALVVWGVPHAQYDQIIEHLSGSNVAAQDFFVGGEPTIDTIASGLESARRSGCDMVMGFGGGSALDTGKAIAVLINNPGEVSDYLEVVGRGKPIMQPGLPYLAVPTTAGTGSEVTSNSVLSAPAADGSGSLVKVSLRSPLMLAKLALVDPALTLDLPASITAQTGLDALTQLIEPFLSNRANPLTDALCREGMRRAAQFLRIVFEDGRNLTGRENLSMASLFGGLALANAKLGAVHGFAGPIGGLLSAPHGAICARLLPLVMRANLSALQTRQPDSPAIPRFAEIATILTGETDARPEDGVSWVEELVADLQIPPLSSYGMQSEQIPSLCGQAQTASSMQGNPIKLTDSELYGILHASLI